MVNVKLPWISWPFGNPVIRPEPGVAATAVGGEVWRQTRVVVGDGGGGGYRVCGSGGYGASPSLSGGNARWPSRNAEDVRACIGTNAVANRYSRTYAFWRHRHSGVYVVFSRFSRYFPFLVFVCELTPVFRSFWFSGRHARTQKHRGRRHRARHSSWCFTRAAHAPFRRVVIPCTDAPTLAVRTRASTQRYACCSVRYTPPKKDDRWSRWVAQ